METQAFLTSDGEPASPEHPSVKDATYAGRIAVCAATLAFLSLIALALTYLITGDAGRWGARRYANALADVQLLRDDCDAGLQRSRMGQAPPISTALCAANAEAPPLPRRSGLRFVAVGDWGRDGMCCQRDVAHRLSQVQSNWAPKFVLNLGDSFYPAGISSADDPQIASSWADVYSRNVPWYSVAGNHDHRGSVNAQLKLSATSQHWHMPALSYFERHADVLFAFLDTTPMYYSHNELRYFQTNFSTADAQTAAQIKRLDSTLQESDAKFKIVIGHHPLYSVGHHFTGEPQNLARMRTHLQQLFERHHVAAYICGHEHSLEHTLVNGVHYFISGGGSKVRQVDNHIPQNLFAIGRQGFMAFAIEDQLMEVFVVDMEGAILHSANISRPL